MCSLRRLFIRAEVWQVVGATRRQLPRDHPDERPQECPHHTLGRAVMVRRVLQDGWTVAAAAAAFEVSVRTVREWLARFRSEGDAGLQNRSSAPRPVAHQLPTPWLRMGVPLPR